MSLRLETLTGAALLPHIASLARLRATVFAEWPYLYASQAEDEARYLRHYAQDQGAAIILAWDSAQLVGAATCQPMRGTHGAVKSTFEIAGRDPAQYCYFGESVLLPAYRGQGAGVGFFHAREAQARRLALPFATFCGVVRNENDPRKPLEYVPLDGFWSRRGYTHHPELSCVFDWTETGDTRPTPHALSFWIRALT